MYMFFADEADQDATQKQYLIYGGVYVPADAALKICKEISGAREKHGFAKDAPLKFSTGTIPAGVTRETHASLKSAVLTVAANNAVKAVCYVAPHDIATKQDKETKLKWAINTLVYNFEKFLKERSDSGCLFLDRTTDFRQEDYLREIMQSGLPKPDGERIEIRRIFSANSTQIGLSELNSLCDIVVGSLRFVFNEPDKNIVGQKLFQQLSSIIWGEMSSDGKRWHVLDRGLIFRPKKFTVVEYEADKQATIQMLIKYRRGEG